MSDGKKDLHIFQGLQQDAGEIRQEPQYLRDALNVRLTARDIYPKEQSKSGLILTNERGTLDIEEDLEGVYLGHCVIDKKCVVFTHKEDTDNPDRIYLIDFKNDYEDPSGILLFNGDLNFSLDYPIQTLASYETTYVLKVYWIDGLNLPRVINIAGTIKEGNNKQFDFIRELKLLEKVTVSKDTQTAGDFESGTILYAFTYFDEFMLETNIVYTTPLYYVSHLNRGASPLERCANAFRINVEDVDLNFDFMRIYAIQRNALNNTPIVRRVLDVDLHRLLNYAHYYEDIGVDNLPDGMWDNKTASEELSPGAWGITLPVEYDLYYTEDTSSDTQSWTTVTIPLENKTVVGYGLQHPIQKYYPTIYQYNCLVINYNEHPNYLLKIQNGDNAYYVTPSYNNNLYVFEHKGKKVIVLGKTKYIDSIYSKDDLNKWKNVLTLEGRVRPKITNEAYETSANNSFTYIDTGGGESVDPKELLFLGGSEIIPLTMCQKDGTLFFGNIKTRNIGLLDSNGDIINGTSIENLFYNLNGISSSTVKIKLPHTTTGLYSHYNSLNVGYSAGFKHGEWYRLGIQFLDNTGRWSSPIWIGDAQLSEFPKFKEDINDDNDGELTIPTFVYTMNSSTLQAFMSNNSDMVKVRPVVIFPDAKEANVCMQGLLQPTLYTDQHREIDVDMYALSSWAIRPFMHFLGEDSESAKIATYGDFLGYSHKCSLPYDYKVFNTDNDDETNIITDYSFIRKVEIQGIYDKLDGDDIKDKQVMRFRRDNQLLTFHSPDIIFDETNWYNDYSSFKLRMVGRLQVTAIMKDCDIITKTGAIGPTSSAFQHYSAAYDLRSGNNTQPMITWLKDWRLAPTGLYYDDFIVDDAKDLTDTKDGPVYYPYSYGYSSSNKHKMSSPVKWPVYMWHRNGSLNNDSDRSITSGVRSADLETKKMSRLFYAGYFPSLHNTVDWDVTAKIDTTINITPIDAQLFNSDLMEIIKVDGKVYQGNVDTLLTPMSPSGFYFAYGNKNTGKATAEKTGNVVNSQVPLSTLQDAPIYGVTRLIGAEDYEGLQTTLTKLKSRLYWKGYTEGGTWYNNVGDSDLALVNHKSPVRMKYRSTSHVAVLLSNPLPIIAETDIYPIAEFYRYDSPEDDEERKRHMFGGLSEDALRSRTWIPAGEPIRLDELLNNQYKIEFTRGDTWYQRYDCLKTYAFTTEDINQVIEIMSFFVESRINLDGRYDRNRGQVNNTYMNPTNFNRLNNVYSQQDNFFNYTILEDLFYENINYPNQLTWGNEKIPGSDIDQWTKINLAATHNMDGDRGEIRGLYTWNNTIYCFLDKGFSRIAFNARVLIDASDGNPIEITNNYKMDGKEYIQDNVGCTNKFAIKGTSSGLYFIDSVSKNLLMFNGLLLTNVSLSHGMSRWFTHLPTEQWTPKLQGKTCKLWSDSGNNDLYINDTDNSLCFSEVMDLFTSFMSYENAFDVAAIDNQLFAFTSKNNSTSVHWLFHGVYNSFFELRKPFYIEFISNIEPEEHKIFNTVEMRGKLWKYSHEQESQEPDDIVTTKLFDTIEAWHDYQSTGEVNLVKKVVVPSIVKDKLGVWRVDIPREKDKFLTRMSNEWLAIRLKNNGYTVDNKAVKLELYDIVVLYSSDDKTNNNSR